MIVQEATVEERLEGLTSEQILQGLTLEQYVRGLTVDGRKLLRHLLAEQYGPLQPLSENPA